MILYAEQQKVVDKLMYFLPKFKFQLLTGEVGSGKTYMGSEIAKRCAKENKKVLIVSPQHVLGKWNEVLNLTFKNEEYLLSNVTVISNIAKVNYYEIYDLIIYDEVHLIKSKIKYVKNLNNFQGVWFVGLTGSIVDKDVSDITNLSNQFARSYFKMYKDSMFGSRYGYVRLFLQVFIAHGLSRDIIQTERKQTEAIVNVHELSVQMNKEESAFYKFSVKRMSRLNLNDSRQLKILNNTLDRVSNSETFTIHGLDYFLGERLTHNSSDKIKLLKETLDSIKENVLIYVMNDSVGQSIENELDNCVFLDVSQQLENSESFVNQHLLNGNKHVIVDITKITTGIDLKANHLIWYQTPIKLNHDIQGTGRITRLSSSNEEKHVYYLYHKNTKQEKLVKILKENRELNNEMIKKQAINNQKSSIPFSHLLPESQHE